MPRAVLIYGLLGILPFWALPAAVVLAPLWTEVAAAIVGAYAALILSFLGGARWGLAVREPTPNPVVIGLSMLPTLGGLAAIVLTHGDVRLQLLALGVALTLSWMWDISSGGAPPWYGRLRTVLTLGAVGGLCVGALQLAG